MENKTLSNTSGSSWDGKIQIRRTTRDFLCLPLEGRGAPPRLESRFLSEVSRQEHTPRRRP